MVISLQVCSSLKNEIKMFLLDHEDVIWQRLKVKLNYKNDIILKLILKYVRLLSFSKISQFYMYLLEKTFL